jgi:hypothetical protein
MKGDADGKPRIGDTTSGLGIRIPKDVQPDEEGCVSPGNGGLSTYRQLLAMAPSFIPPEFGLGGTGKGLAVFKILDEQVAANRLTARDDRSPGNEGHVFLEPESKVPVATYRECLLATRPAWVKVEP